MGIEVSVEVTHSPNELAGVIDQELHDISLYIPSSLKLAASGETVVLHEKDGVGVLSAAYMGKQVVRVTAQGEGYEGQLGFYQDFQLDYWQHPHLIEPTVAADFEGCEPGFLGDLFVAIHELHRDLYESQFSSQT